MLRVDKVFYALSKKTEVIRSIMHFYFSCRLLRPEDLPMAALFAAEGVVAAPPPPPPTKEAPGVPAESFPPFSSRSKSSRTCFLSVSMLLGSCDVHGETKKTFELIRNCSNVYGREHIYDLITTATTTTTTSTTSISKQVNINMPVLTSRVVPLREADSFAFLASEVFSRYVIDALTVSSQPCACATWKVQ